MAVTIVPGGIFGAVIWFDYKGPAARLWVGFGISPHEDKSDIYQYVGAYIDAPQSPDWSRLHVRVEGVLGSNPPSPGQHHECFVFVGTGPDYHTEIEGHWDHDTYTIAEMEVDEAKQWLTSLKGVGPKTAAIVLLFSDKPLANDSISSPSFISSDSNSPARSSLVAISLSSSSTFFLNAKISPRVGPYFLFRRLISSNLASISSSLSGFTSTFWP